MKSKKKWKVNNMYAQTKSIKVSDITHKHLSRMGRKGESFDLIIARLIQEHLVVEMNHDFARIRELAGDTLILKKNDSGSPQRVLDFDVELSKIEAIFNEIDFDYGVYPDWRLKDAVEMASDEDNVGGAVAFGERDLTLAEVTINTYCLYLEMPSPTFGNGLMISPLSDH